MRAFDFWRALPSAHEWRDAPMYQLGLAGYWLEGPEHWWTAASLLDFALSRGADVFPYDMRNELARAHLACRTIYGLDQPQPPQDAAHPSTSVDLAGVPTFVEHPLRFEYVEAGDVPKVLTRLWMDDIADVEAARSAAREISVSAETGEIVVDDDDAVHFQVATPDHELSIDNLDDPVRWAVSVTNYVATCMQRP
jgi:hypothetical protein